MKKILIAEDDQYLAKAYKIKLSNAGFEVMIQPDGEETLNALARFKPDIILLDLIMPVKDGFATLKELKAHEEWKNIPVIIASNLGEKEDIDAGKQLGAADYVSKSNLKLEEVIVKINKLLETQNPSTTH